MYRSTRFGELMKGLPRKSFTKIVKRLKGDKYCKGFDPWDHLIALVYAQLSGSESLREVETGFNSQCAAHYHLGSREVKRSTLADANRQRNAEVFAEVCGQLMGQAQRKLRREMKDLLYLLDSTPIPLKGLGYEWAQENHNHRTHGLKVHMLYAPQQGIPVRADITSANVNDIETGREIPVEAGATYVFDKGYNDYNWWYSLHEQEATFITRLKQNASVRHVSSLTVSTDAGESGILEDVVVEFKHKQPGGKRINHYHGTPVRRITVHRPDKERPLILICNDFDRSAEEIADLYKQRWGIELFFKWLKQNLKIKRFLGRSENAVRIQIYTALITYLLAHLYACREGVVQSLKLWLVEVRAGLFQRPETEQTTARKRKRESQALLSMQGVLAL